MKVCYICDVNLGLENAPVIHIMEVINNLKKLDYDIDLFAPKLGKYNHKTSLKIKYLKIINKPVLWVISYEIILFFSLFYYALKGKPDIFYVRQSDSLIVPFLISKLLHIPIVLENNGNLEKEAVMQGCSTFRIKGLRIIEKICCKYASRIFTVTPEIKKNIITKYNINPEKIIIIRNGVDTDLFKPLNIKEVRNEQRLSDDFYYVGYIGNLAVWQGVEHLIKSLPFVLKKIPNVKYFIVGEGTEKKRLEAIAKNLKIDDKIIFTGSVSHRTIPKYINSFNICVAPFVKERNAEASPLKLYEYFSCSKPVIVSSVNQSSDFEEKLVVTSKPEDAEDLAIKIIMLIENPQLREQLGNRGRSYVLNGHSWSDVVCHIHEILQEIIRNDKRIEA
ncbi:MAG: glycosyltransferase family 4 protein [Actinobacteria bacterium]|nr:glycosyltransferase family 4 protein [Actinomycetota bacterium]